MPIINVFFLFMLSDAGSVSSLDLNQPSPLPGSPLLAARNQGNDTALNSTDPDGDIPPVVAENPKWTKMLEKLEQELTRLPTGSGLDGNTKESADEKEMVESESPGHKENAPENKISEASKSADLQVSDTALSKPSIETASTSAELITTESSASQAISKESFEITEATSSTSSVSRSTFSEPTPPKHMPVQTMDSEDFYSRYKSSTPGSPPEAMSIEDAFYLIHNLVFPKHSPIP